MTPQGYQYSLSTKVWRSGRVVQVLKSDTRVHILLENEVVGHGKGVDEDNNGDILSSSGIHMPIILVRNN